MSAGFIWHELMTSDPGDAKAFYAAVMGWTPEPFPGTSVNYTVMKVGERGVAGIMQIPEAAKAGGMPPKWVGYIQAGDIDAEVAALQRAGGTLHRGPEEIGGGVGRFAVTSDPQGALYMLLEPQMPAQPPVPPMMPGHVGWNELMTDDWEKAFDYYSGLYGWTKGNGMDMGDMGIYQLVALEGTDMGAMMNRPSRIPVSWGFYFIVDGLDAAVKRVTDNGGKITMEPMEVPGGQWVANCADPQGAHFGMVSDKKCLRPPASWTFKGLEAQYARLIAFDSEYAREKYDEATFRQNPDRKSRRERVPRDPYRATSGRQDGRGLFGRG